MPSHLSIAQMVFAVKISICELFFFSSQMIIKNILGKIVTTFNTYFLKNIMMTINCHLICFF